MANKEGIICQWYVKANDPSYGSRIPGFRILGKGGSCRLCPRNLPPKEAEKSRPDGKKPCPNANPARCSSAWQEQLSCPVRGTNALKTQRYEDFDGGEEIDHSDWE